MTLSDQDVADVEVALTAISRIEQRHYVDWHLPAYDALRNARSALLAALSEADA